MRVLITGSAGRIGRAIYVRLARDMEVVGLDRAPATTVDVVGDICDPFLLRHALRDIDAVVHVAGLHAPHVGHVADAEFDRINVHATAALIDIAARLGVQRFVFTSTTALYGAAGRHPTQAVWVDEELTPTPLTVYHRSKIAAEQALASSLRRAPLPITILRISRCFPEAAPLMAAYRLHRGVDARDVAEAHALALAENAPGLRRYLISGLMPFLPQDLDELLADAPAVLRRRAPALVEAFAGRGWALPRSIDRVYSPQRAMDVLGWKPRYGFAEVLRMLDDESSEVLPPQRHEDAGRYARGNG